MLGRFFIALICQAAQERASIDAELRQSTFLYIDEAHDYFDESMENLLNQARKYKVGLVLAHQNLDQFDTRLRAETRVRYATERYCKARPFEERRKAPSPFTASRAAIAEKRPSEKGPSQRRCGLYGKQIGSSRRARGWRDL